MAALRFALIALAGACVSEPSRPACSKARPLSELNVAEHDQDPWLSPDRKELFFVSDRAGTVPGRQIWRATRDSYDGRFDAPRQIAGDFVNGNDVDSPWLSSDGVTLYFSQWRTRSQIFSAVRADPTSTLFTNARMLLDDAEEPSLTADERTVYYARSDGHLYRATRASKADVFSNPTKIEELATPDDQSDPWIDPDDTVLTYTAGVATGQTRIVRSHFATRAFMPPEEVAETDLPDPAANIHSPMVHAGGKTIVFSSDVTGGSASNDLFITCE